MGKVYNLSEQAVAREIIAKYPEIKKILDKLGKELYPYRKYVCAYNVLKEMDRSLQHIEDYLPAYQQLIKGDSNGTEST